MSVKLVEGRSAEAHNLMVFMLFGKLHCRVCGLKRIFSNGFVGWRDAGSVKSGSTTACNAKERDDGFRFLFKVSLFISLDWSNPLWKAQEWNEPNWLREVGMIWKASCFLSPCISPCAFVWSIVHTAHHKLVCILVSDLKEQRGCWVEFKSPLWQLERLWLRVRVTTWKG